MRMPLVAMMVTYLAVASWVTAGPADQEEPWNRHTGPYLEANLGTGFSYLGIFSQEFDLSDGAVGGLSWVGAVGYGLTPHHAIEGGVGQWYTDFEDDDEGGEEDVSGHLNMGYVAWRGTLFIKDRSTIFFKLGAMVVAVPETETNDAWGVAPFTGVGVSHALTRRIDLSLQYQGGVYVLASAGALTLGAAYHF